MLDHPNHLGNVGEIQGHIEPGCLFRLCSFPVLIQFPIEECLVFCGAEHSFDATWCFVERMVIVIIISIALFLLLL